MALSRKGKKGGRRYKGDCLRWGGQSMCLWRIGLLSGGELIHNDLDGRDESKG